MQPNSNHPNTPNHPPQQRPPITQNHRPPSRQLLLGLPSGERLTTAYQPLAHPTAGNREGGRRESGRDENEEWLIEDVM